MKVTPTGAWRAWRRAGSSVWMEPAPAARLPVGCAWPGIGGGTPWRNP